MEAIQKIFEKIGGEFVTPYAHIQQKLSQIKAYVFDWDGVFNNGAKSSGQTASFSEADSMGINLLRFDHWCINQTLPVVCIVTGEDNPTAVSFAERENFHGLFKNVKDKSLAIAHICEEHHLQPSEIACFWDDVTDLSMARMCGIRMMLKRSASPLFENYSKAAGYCDYITGHGGAEHGLREACELILGMHGNYEQRIASRLQFDNTYRTYFEQRKQVHPIFFQQLENKISAYQIKN